MKLANVIEGGLSGVTTLSLLQEALQKVDGNASKPSGMIKQFKKLGTKKGNNSKAFIKLAGELLSNSAYYGLSGLGKKKNAVIRGGLLGAAAGLGYVLLKDYDHSDTVIAEDKTIMLKKKILTVTLYTAGGILAGFAIKNRKDKTKKNRKKK